MHEPVIILTCMRSYSSLVSAMLGQHPALYTLPEINPFVGPTIGAIIDVLMMVRPRSLDGLLRLVAELEFGGQTRETVEDGREWLRARRGWPTARFLGHVSQRIAPRRFVEKSPSTVVTTDGIKNALRTYPNAFYLHLHRHPSAVCRSLAAIARSGERPQRRGKDPETSWYKANSAILWAAGRVPPGHFMSVRGKDVLADPDRYLAQICAWLDLETDPGILAAMRHPERSPFASLGPENAPFGNDPGFLREPAYTQRPISDPALSAELDWARPGRRLKSRTIALAHQLGYCDGPVPAAEGAAQ